LIEFVKRVFRQKAFWVMYSKDSNEGKDGGLVCLGGTSSSVSKEGWILICCDPLVGTISGWGAWSFAHVCEAYGLRYITRWIVMRWWWKNKWT
jgi:hypothetical protein